MLGTAALIVGFLWYKLGSSAEYRGNGQAEEIEEEEQETEKDADLKEVAKTSTVPVVRDV